MNALPVGGKTAPPESGRPLERLRSSPCREPVRPTRNKTSLIDKHVDVVVQNILSYLLTKEVTTYLLFGKNPKRITTGTYLKLLRSVGPSVEGPYKFFGLMAMALLNRRDAAYVILLGNHECIACWW